MAKRKRKKNPTLRWVVAVLAAAGAFELGGLFRQFCRRTAGCGPGVLRGVEGFELNRILSCIACLAAAERSNAGIPSVVCRHTAGGMLFFVPRFVSWQMGRGVC